LFNPDFTWQFKTEPSEGSGGRAIPHHTGRTLGGSSSIDSMIYNRGQRADLESWAQRGNRSWHRVTRRNALGDNNAIGIGRSDRNHPLLRLAVIRDVDVIS
jgi:choline dehydrogenase-like flavoprotein